MPNWFFRTLMSFFDPGNIPLKAGAILFVVVLIVGHSSLPHQAGLMLAAGMSIAMNLTYPMAAIAERKFVALELSISGTLILLSLLGLFASPWLLVVAIFGHGVWDLSKHAGHKGVGFFPWYCVGCVIVDWTWATVLSVLVLIHS